MLDFIYHVYIDYLWTPLVYLEKFFESNQIRIFFLIIILFATSIIRSKVIKNNQTKISFIPTSDKAQNTVKKLLAARMPIHIIILDKTITLLNLTLAALIIGVCARYVLARS